MPQVTTAPVGSITATPAKTLRANAIRIMRISGVKGRGRGKRK